MTTSLYILFLINILEVSDLRFLHMIGLLSFLWVYFDGYMYMFLLSKNPRVKLSNIFGRVTLILV